MRLNATFCVYDQQLYGNADDNGAAVMSATVAIKTVMKIWQLMVRMKEKMEGKSGMIVIMLMMLMRRKKKREMKVSTPLWRFGWSRFLGCCLAERVVGCHGGLSLSDEETGPRFTTGVSQQPPRRPMEAHANRRRWCCPPLLSAH